MYSNIFSMHAYILFMHAFFYAYLYVLYACILFLCLYVLYACIPFLCLYVLYACILLSMLYICIYAFVGCSDRAPTRSRLPAPLKDLNSFLCPDQLISVFFIN